MRPRVPGALLVVVWAAAMACAAQPGSAGAPAPTGAAPLDPEEAVEAYIERLGLNRLLAEQLALRLQTEEKADRVALAERLGRMYVQLLTDASSTEDRSLWEQRGRDLLRDVPEADTSELRLSLNKAVYAKAEEVVERSRLRLAEAAESQEAERQLRALEPQFTDIAVKAHRRVESLERLENAGDSTDELAAELSEARRIRSLAFYYAGWCQYYLAYLGGSGGAGNAAVDSLKSFGWLLNSPNGRAATPDRLPAPLLRYEHIARAAIGSALACGVRGNDGDAVRWLDAIEQSDEITDAIREQLLVRRITVLSDAKRWADLDFVLRKARKADRSGGGPDLERLPVGAARLLAVAVLEADKRVAREQIEGLARVAFADLVARQEIGQVIDLVRRYGTAPIGETGFIVNYVRGLLQYDQARDAHKQLDAAAEEPTKDAAAANLYRAAGAMLESALQQPDASDFKLERAKAAVTLGRSEFFAGDLAGASERFAQAWDLAGRGAGGEVAEEAMWLAVVAFDRASREGGAGAGTQATRRAELAALFLQTYPDSSRASRIVLMQAAGGDVSEDEALRILSEVPRDSPVYEPARRQVARLLYNKVRAGRGAERDFAAMRFIGVSEELLALDRKAAMQEDHAAARAACERLVVRVRQMLDALLGGASPDAERAQAVLEVLESAATYNNLDLGEHAAEIMFRRAQIALARDREAEAAAMVEQLAGLAAGPGRVSAQQFAAAADRLLYRRVAARWKQSSAEAAASTESVEADARMLVRIGQRVIGQIGQGKDALLDPAVVTLYATVAAAATSLAGGPEGGPMRQLAIDLDQAVLRAQPRLEDALRRLAVNAEASGDPATSAECWRTLFAGAAQGTPAWFEARFQSLRLLASLDPARGRQAIDQHRLLYPEYGPAPWGERIRELDSQIPANAPATPTPPTGGAP